jgi:hydrogenase expression/formation protein HypC
MCLAIPGRVVQIESDVDPSFRMAKVDFTGIVKQISLSLTPEAQLGDYVLVHVGFALTIISEEEAAKTIAFLQTVAGPDELRRELEAEESEGAS